MIEDPLVEEIHQIRREIAAEFGGDVHKFFEYLRQRQAADGKSNVVTLQPNAPERIASLTSDADDPPMT